MRDCALERPIMPWIGSALEQLHREAHSAPATNAEERGRSASSAAFCLYIRVASPPPKSPPGMQVERSFKQRNLMIAQRRLIGKLAEFAHIPARECGCIAMITRKRQQRFTLS